MPPAAGKGPDPAAEPIERFAYDLRQLREQAGSLDYRSMARRAGLAHSTLSTAASGRKLPSLETTLGFVRACGADTQEQARWAKRWKQTRAQLDQAKLTDAALPIAPTDPVPPPPLGDALLAGGQEVPARTPGRTPTPRRPWHGRWRRAAITAVAAAAVVAAAAWIGPNTHPAPASSTAGAPTALPITPTAIAASSRPPTTPEAERRHGPLVTVPDTVVDLDSSDADWGVRTSPGVTDDDIEFTSDHTLTGLGHADMAILPAGDVGTFDDCAQYQDYGVELPAAAIRPGVLLCDITTQKHVALMRVIDVQHDATGVPDQVTLDVVVWVRPYTD